MLFNLTMRGRNVRPGVIPAVISIFLLAFLSAVQVHAQETGGRFARIDLVTDAFGRAAYSDSRLVNPWGIVNAPEGGPWWIVDEGKGRSTVYSGEGAPLPGLSPFSVTIPVNPGGVFDDATPRGVVSNDENGFELAPGMPARLLFATGDGTVAGWNRDVDRTDAVLVMDNSPAAVYTGVATAETESGRALYLANFRQARIEAYNTDFSPIIMNVSAFTDPLIPDGYSPYNIQNVDGELYVTFAEPRAGGRDAASGDGAGYADIFDTKGNLVLRLEHGPWMNAPWAVALAPIGFGGLGNHLLVGNTGSGRIAVYDRQTGSYQGYVMDSRGIALVIPGLHGLGFGNDGLAGPATALYFTAGREKGGRNIFGAVIPQALLPQTALPTAFSELP